MSKQCRESVCNFGKYLILKTKNVFLSHFPHRILSHFGMLFDPLRIAQLHRDRAQFSALLCLPDGVTACRPSRGILSA